MGERGRRTTPPEQIRERAVRRRREAPTWGVAIVLHGGQAESALKRFRKLSVHKQAHLISFLSTLQVP